MASVPLFVNKLNIFLESYALSANTLTSLPVISLLKAIREENSAIYGQMVETRDLKRYEEVS